MFSIIEMIMMMMPMVVLMILAVATELKELMHIAYAPLHHISFYPPRLHWLQYCWYTTNIPENGLEVFCTCAKSVVIHVGLTAYRVHPTKSQNKFRAVQPQRVQPIFRGSLL